MKITCISASNTRLMGSNSASTKVCNLIKNIIISDHSSDALVETLPLVNYDLKPCILCGNCYGINKCAYNDDFNKLFEILPKSDALFLVVPHYSPIPSKLMIIFEKLNEIAYSGWLNNSNYVFPLRGIPIGIIGHGGMVEKPEVLKYYHDSLITPVANTLKSLSLDVVPMNETYPNGATFGLRNDDCLRRADNSVFPEIVQDYTLIEERIKPLIDNVIGKII